ncbi:MAG: enoyl-CoA hydratase/isomerase family protein [Acidimicrobiia bacterium]|nr:enoyl-CoA hydratase/isomerase family protein [Acidimicrobiia bacterium]
MVSFDTLSIGLDEGIGRLTLDQPDALNPLGSAVLAELAQAASWFDAQRVPVVIVTGAGSRSFSSGFDLRELAAPASDGPGAAELGRRMADAIADMDAVAIAAIHGHCIGGGVVLAAACDIRIAADNTVFAIPEVDLGIPLGWGGIPRLVREIGPAMTRELVMSCRPFDAQEAKAIGFVNRVVARDRLDETVTELAATLSTKAPSLLRATKRQVQTAAEAVASTEGSWSDAALIGMAQTDPDARAAANAYLERRTR